MVVMVRLSKQLLVSRRTTAARRMKRRGEKRRKGMKVTHDFGKVESRREDEMEGMGSDVEGWVEFGFGLWDD